MKLKILFLAIFISLMWSCKDDSEKKVNETAENKPEIPQNFTKSNIDIHPIGHATMVLEWDETVFYIDPVGGAEAFKGMKDADIILITDIHGDHLNIETLQAVKNEKNVIIAPQAVIDKLPEVLKTGTKVLVNDAMILQNTFSITAVPMYNLREEALQFHEKGRGNGYILEKGNYRIYISGDTEDIPEMRKLKDIDLAFVCMNLPFTMTVESAASAVAEFKPKTVVPYHYRGREGFSDVDTFERLVKEKATEVEVKRLNFYPNN